MFYESKTDGNFWKSVLEAFRHVFLCPDNVPMGNTPDGLEPDRRHRSRACRNICSPEINHTLVSYLDVVSQLLYRTFVEENVQRMSGHCRDKMSRHRSRKLLGRLVFFARNLMDMIDTSNPEHWGATVRHSGAPLNLPLQNACVPCNHMFTILAWLNRPKLSKKD